MFPRAILSLLFMTVSASAEPIAWWRCDSDRLENPLAHPQPGNIAKRDDATPGAFVYDPLTGVSRANSGSLRIHNDSRAKTSDIWKTDVLGDLSSGFTLEAFIRVRDGNIGDDRVVARLSGAADIAEIRVTRQSQYPWWSGRLAAAGEPSSLLEPLYMDLTHVRPDVWRHFALTYDGATKIARFYVDYTLKGETTLKSPLALDKAVLRVGGDSAGRGIDGWIDEIRLTGKSLSPWEFLRASPHELKNVSFRPVASELFPADMGFVDVKLRYGAVGDGVADDTLAFRRAFEELASRVPIAYYTLWVPPGTYRLTDTIQWSRFLVVQGAGRDRTIFRLSDRTEGFGDPKSPRPVVVASNWKRGNKGGSGSAIGSYLFDATIDTGAGNPGAVALDFHTNNHGAVENVRLRSGDGKGVAGLDCTRPWCGPCLFKNLEIEGFDIGVVSSHREYSLVFSRLTLRKQNVVGIRNADNLLSIEKLTSENRVPVMTNKGGGLLVLIDAELNGGDAETAIDNNAVMYLRDVRATGYRTIAAGLPGPRVAEHHSHKAVSGHPSPDRPLNLPISETPTPAAEMPSAWLNVRSFQHLVKDRDWTTAIQAALDSGKATIYFPANGSYQVRDTLRVPATVKRLIGAISGIGGDAKHLGDKPILRIEGDSTEPIFFERIRVQRGGKDANGLIHASSRPLVFRHGSISEYRTEAGVGPAYFENVEGVFRFLHPQSIWGRHMNPETHDIPEIVNEGATLWILGLKTEYASVNLVNRKGAKTEVLGGLIYPVTPVPADMPMFINDESSLSLICGISAYPNNHKIYVQDSRDGKKVDVASRQFSWIAGRPMIPLFTSYKKE